LTILLTLSAARADEVEFCFFVCTVKRPVVDSFCQVYQQVNLNAADSVAIKGLPRGPKVRLNANEVLYLCKCRAWDNPICKTKEP
jgi:hypothetical protein